MSSKNLFEVATRKQYRFHYKGMLSVEELWQLPLNGLDSVFKALNSQVKQATEESLLDNKTKEDEELTNKIEIVKHIVEVKLSEQSVKEGEKLRKERNQKIMSILAIKEEDELQNKSPEELRSMLEE